MTFPQQPKRFLPRIVRRGPAHLPGRPGHTPIVLAHGILGHGNYTVGPFSHRYFYGVEDALAEAGHPVLVPALPPVMPVEKRAAALAEQIAHWPAAHDAKPIVVAHSMAGLDARHALAHLGLAEKVAALVTVATPHHGSPAADWVAARDHLGPLDPFALLQKLGLDATGGRCLTTACCHDFNDATPDVDGFPYFSVTTGRERAGLFVGLRFTHDLIHPHEGLNDGLVSATSGTHGEHLAHWPVDHTHSRNQRLTAGLEDVTPRYLAVLDDLAGRGLVERAAAVAA